MSPSEQRVAVLLNPNAKCVSAAVRGAIANVVAPEDIFISHDEDDARAIARTVVERGYRTVFTGGGDGTFMGFLNKILPPDQLIEHVTRYASTLADSVSPGSARETKRQIYRDLHRDAAASVIEAERLLEDMIRHPDYGEGVKAWMEKRVAAWTG